VNKSHALREVHSECKHVGKYLTLYAEIPDQQEHTLFLVPNPAQEYISMFQYVILPSPSTPGMRTERKGLQTLDRFSERGSFLQVYLAVSYKFTSIPASSAQHMPYQAPLRRMVPV
jgi:hypothetical protein